MVNNTQKEISLLQNSCYLKIAIHSEVDKLRIKFHFLSEAVAEARLLSVQPRV